MSALGIDTMLLLPSLKLLYPAPRKEHGFLPPCFSSPKPSSSCSCSSLKAVFSVSCRKTQYFRPSSVCLVRRVRAKASEGQSSSLEEEKEEAEEPEFQVVSAVRSNYNEIVIVDTPDSRVLLLDSTHNVHSIFRKGQKWTGSYWDEFASLPAIVPHGPIAILGLGGGTAAHLMLELWPSLKLEGWEIDAILIDKAREYLGLSDLEKCTEAGGVLHVHVGDALSPLAVVPGGFAGIVVDLFSDGKVLPQLQEVVHGQKILLSRHCTKHFLGC
ncbi:PREDICTED: uncharacterized protein LOC104593530 isoform X2 [Nelumbo nucifera]|uniref:Uncharacterized protein LOC104593530 isoform X2 n=1 Tax=Nelumbo nucifera TaxID=4432 RepID=A0A1U7ZFP1_NELNU|nr:PREDICTED: uncharacterized protein LOC104593530 isoform X2 [Nelumbo nucifera]